MLIVEFYLLNIIILLLSKKIIILYQEFIMQTLLILPFLTYFVYKDKILHMVKQIFTSNRLIGCESKLLNQ